MGQTSEVNRGSNFQHKITNYQNNQNMHVEVNLNTKMAPAREEETELLETTKSQHNGVTQEMINVGLMISFNTK